MSYKHFVRTGLTKEALVEIETSLVEFLNNEVTLSNRSFLEQFEPVDHIIANPIPVVVLINGAGGNGKDTFIERVGKNSAVLNLSSINEIKDVAARLVEYNTEYQDLEEVSSYQHMVDKSDSYREFLHELKMAWTKYCDGPNVHLLGEIRKAMNDQCTGMNRYDMIFCHVREAKEITDLKRKIENVFGLPVITVLVKGIVDPSEYKNACDANVEEYHHDIEIINRPMEMTVLDMQAFLFALKIGYKMRAIGMSADSCIMNTDCDVNNGYIDKCSAADYQESTITAWNGSIDANDIADKILNEMTAEEENIHIGVDPASIE